MSSVEVKLQTASSQNALEAMMTPVGEESTSDSTQTRRGQKRKLDDVDDEEEDDQSHDEVRLWEDGFKDRYYESKFDVGPDQLEFR